MRSEKSMLIFYIKITHFQPHSLADFEQLFQFKTNPTSRPP